MSSRSRTLPADGAVAPGNVTAVSDQTGILARGPWTADQVQAVWRDEHYEPSGGHVDAADQAISALRERGSPSHDGVAARLVSHRIDEDGRLHLELQPIRWALRLVEGDASDSVAGLCVIRDGDGRWLAGRRAAWLSSWAGRWALGAGGAVDPFENPVDTLTRELQEEWELQPERLQVEALVRLPHRLVMLVGQAWVAAGSQVVMDHEHDAHAWWPPDPADWPEEADEPLRHMAQLLAGVRPAP
jgi:8-oxo-dGTP diphosphatase